MWKNPWWFLWLIPALAAALAAAWAASTRRARLNALLGAPQTLKRMLPEGVAARRRLKLALRLSALALIFVALAGPQWGVNIVASTSRARQVLIAADTSLSMSAQDVAPSRLEAAKRDLSLLLDELSGNRIGLMAFAGDSALICPMTLDEDAVRQAANSLSPDMLPVPGTAIGKAISQAAQLLSPYPGVKALVILSDGGDHKSHPLAAAKAAAAAGVRIYAIGFGTPEGSPIALRDSSGHLTGYKKNAKGETVVTRLHEDILSKLSAATGGAYFRADADQSEVSAVAQQILKTTEAQDVSSQENRYRNHFQWPLAAAFFLMLAGFLIPEFKDERKSRMGPWLALVLLLPAHGASAATAEGDLRKGNALYKQQNYLNALDMYSAAAAKVPGDLRPVFNSGDALFRLQDLDEAKKAFGALAADPAKPAKARSAAFYNLGDIDFARQDYKAAVDDFRNAVVLNPSDPEARYNLAVALRALKNPPPKKKNQQQKQNKNNSQRPDNPKPQGGGQNNAQQPNQPQPQNQMSKEDAKRLMQAVAAREKPMSPKIKSKARQGSTDEDW